MPPECAILGNAAKSAELDALKAGKSVRDSAVAGQRFRKNQEWDAKSMGANWFGRQAIELEKFQFERGVKLDAQLDAARAASRGSSGGGGGGAAALSALTATTNGLKEQNLALEALSQGQFSTMEAARLWAEQVIKGGGAVDTQTAKMLLNIDALALRNKTLQETPDNLGASLGKSVETNLESAIRKSLSGEKTSILDFGKAIQQSVAGALAMNPRGGM